MPLLMDPVRPQGPSVEVRASAAIELEWALASAHRSEYRRDHAALAALYDQHPGLADRVRSFWGDDCTTSCGGSIELMALAHHGGLLFSTDGLELLRRLGDLCDTHPAELTLASETDDDRTAVLLRLERLRSSPELRGRYIELLTDVWRAVYEIWERSGRPAVEAAIASRRDLLAKGTPWPDIAGAECDFEGLRPRLVDALGPSGVLAIVPAYFTHRGLLVDLPGVVIVGVRAEPSGAEARARTELLARRLKTISDPTRLAILDSLTKGPQTITEVASTFGLAQPTVSNHVKLMRDAGLIASARNGNRRDLVVDHDAVGALLDQLQKILHRPVAP